jgi:hypothetical protein
MLLIFVKGTTADLLKDILTIFYAPLAQVYKAASIADSLGDLQSFINDLIKTVEQAEEGNARLCFVYQFCPQSLLADIGDPTSTVKTFVDLVQRHEQSFYTFVHKVHSKGAELFDDLLRWIELFLTFVREGLGESLSLEFLLPHTGSARQEIIREVDAVALYHYRLKVARESKVRQRFRRGGSSGDQADEDEKATQALISDVVNDFNFGDLIHGDMEELMADSLESSEEGSSEYDSSEEETDSENSSEENEQAQVPRPMTPQSPATKLVPPSAPLPHAHMSATRSSIDVIPPPVQKHGETKLLSRKRSFSFRLNKSSSDLRKPNKSGPIPPVPPLPLHIPSTSQSHSPFAPVTREHVSVTPTPSASDGPILRRRKTVDGIKHLSVDTSRSNERSPSRTVYRPAVKPRKRKKKLGPNLEPPELKHIPTLLPLFVEIVCRIYTIKFLFMLTHCFNS